MTGEHPDFSFGYKLKVVKVPEGLYLVLVEEICDGGSTASTTTNLAQMKLSPQNINCSYPEFMSCYTSLEVSDLVIATLPPIASEVIFGFAKIMQAC